MNKMDLLRNFELYMYVFKGLSRYALYGLIAYAMGYGYGFIWPDGEFIFLLAGVFAFIYLLDRRVFRKLKKNPAS